MDKQIELRLINNWQKNKCLISRNKLIEINMGIITKIAIKFCNFNDYLKEELIQEGVIAAINCLNTFDSTKDYRLVTLLASSVRFRLLKYLRVNTLVCNKKGLNLSSINNGYVSINTKEGTEELSKFTTNMLLDDIEKEDLIYRMSEYINNLPEFEKDCFRGLVNLGEQNIVAKKYNTSRQTVLNYKNLVKLKLRNYLNN